MPGKPLARGVYRLPWLDEDGRTMLIAIDSRGRCVGGPVRLFRGEDVRAAAASLRRVLDEIDAPSS